MENPQFSSSIHSAILQAWECAFANSRITYLSGPITTGLQYVLNIQTGTGKSKAEIIRENCTILQNTAVQLRKDRCEIVVEPASLNIVHWSQIDYLSLWGSFIERHVNLILFLPGWEYSYGSASEFYRAQVAGVRTETISGSPITLDDALALFDAARERILGKSISENEELRILASKLGDIFTRIGALRTPSVTSAKDSFRKDSSLNFLANTMNVAQFVSFSPSSGRPKQEYARIAGESPNMDFPDVSSAIERLLRSSADNLVNVRSYEPNNPQSREFIYGLSTVVDAVAAVDRLTRLGLHTIVNETIDINDGGVSGVLMGDVLEFSPDDTPRCVEKPGTTSLPRGWGRELLANVYGFPLHLNVPLASRLEFSIHPRPRGWRQTNVLAWEYSEQSYIGIKPSLHWPNRFSRMIGDKTFGLLIAHHVGLPVPFTTVLNRRIAPFSFGRPTGIGEMWIRTAPLEQVPGKFTTRHGWLDPFKLVNTEDPLGEVIVSVLSQQGVPQSYSGALIVGANGEVIIEGKKGEGETFMQGRNAPENLPKKILADVTALYTRAEALLGIVRFEWVHDGEKVWILQIHVGATNSGGGLITHQRAAHWQTFDTRAGLEELRKAIVTLPAGVGIELVGRVGLTSHFADVLRRANVPARMA